MDELLGREAGHEVTGFDGAETSLDQIAASDPELLVVDVMVEGEKISGWSLLPLARIDPRFAHVPMIVFSAESVESQQRLEELATVGGVRLLRKPISAEDLYRTAEELLRPRPVQ